MAITTLSGINAAVKKAVKHELSRRDDDSVFGVVREAQMRHIKTDVYDVYTPKMYKRRGIYGGLDDSTFVVGKNNSSALSIMNITKPNPITDAGRYVPKTDILAEIVEYGLNPKSKLPYAYLHPRPFIKNTRQEIGMSGAHVQAMKRGLSSQGFIVK